MTITMREERARQHRARLTLNVHVDARHGGRVDGSCDRCIFQARLAYGVDLVRRGSVTEPKPDRYVADHYVGCDADGRPDVACSLDCNGEPRTGYGTCDACGETCTMVTVTGGWRYCGTCL
jgi:hypothetical protein